MGHWGTSPSISNCLILHVTSEPHKLLTVDSLWLPTQKKNTQAYSFVTVYCMNFIIIFLCVTLKLSFVPLLAPNPGDTIALYTDRRQPTFTERRVTSIVCISEEILGPGTDVILLLRPENSLMGHRHYN